MASNDIKYLWINIVKIIFTVNSLFTHIIIIYIKKVNVTLSNRVQ